MLDEMVDFDEEMIVSLDVLIRKKERVIEDYNKEVKVKTFSIRECVWKVTLLMDRKNRALGN